MVKRVYKWKLMLTRPLGRPKNRWEDGIIDDIKKLKIKNWTSCIQDRKKKKKEKKKKKKKKKKKEEEKEKEEKEKKEKEKKEKEKEEEEKKKKKVFACVGSDYSYEYLRIRPILTGSNSLTRTMIFL
jgi:FKBP-type peptidyl-prolyl cis-trans isomerase